MAKIKYVVEKERWSKEQERFQVIRLNRNGQGMGVTTYSSQTTAKVVAHTLNLYADEEV